MNSGSDDISSVAVSDLDARRAFGELSNGFMPILHQLFAVQRAFTAAISANQLIV
jgi:hypothetical protein